MRPRPGRGSGRRGPRHPRPVPVTRALSRQPGPRPLPQAEQPSAPRPGWGGAAGVPVPGWPLYPSSLPLSVRPSPTLVRIRFLRSGPAPLLRAAPVPVPTSGAPPPRLPFIPSGPICPLPSQVLHLPLHPPQSSGPRLRLVGTEQLHGDGEGQGGRPRGSLAPSDRDTPRIRGPSSPLHRGRGHIGAPGDLPNLQERGRRAWKTHVGSAGSSEGALG